MPLSLRPVLYVRRLSMQQLKVAVSSRKDPELNSQPSLVNYPLNYPVYTSA